MPALCHGVQTRVVISRVELFQNSLDWGNNGTIDHVGIVESVSGGTVNTIEGNSGDKVARRSYSIGSSNIYGYGVPAY